MHHSCTWGTAPLRQPVVCPLEKMVVCFHCDCHFRFSLFYVTKTFRQVVLLNYCTFVLQLKVLIACASDAWNCSSEPAVWLCWFPSGATGKILVLLLSSTLPSAPLVLFFAPTTNRFTMWKRNTTKGKALITIKTTSNMSNESFNTCSSSFAL